MIRYQTNLLLLSTLVMVGLLLQSTAHAATELEKLTASDGVAGDRFGSAISISGNTAFVGAYLDDGTLSNTGSVYVFTRSGGVWSQQQKLTASDAVAGDSFGTSVSVSGDTAAIGSDSDDGAGFQTGSVYIFTRTGGVWSEQQKLKASDASSVFTFNVVSLSGDTLVVGASRDALNVGSAYVFTRSGGVWTEQQKLIAGDGATSDRFGNSVSLSGDTVVVGAFRDDHSTFTDSGSAYVFTRSGSVWSEQQKLTASDAADADWFGSSVSISGDTVVVGAPFDDDTATESGSVYIFTRSAGVWSPQQKLNASDAAMDDEFGFNVSVADDTVLVGARFDDDTATDSGSAYVFTRSAGVWSPQQKLNASDAAADALLGLGISISDGLAVVGATTLSGIGGAYVFKVDLTPPNVVSITPSTTGPTGADDLSFTVVFDEAVTGLDDASDVVITHTDTANSGLSFSGSGDTHTVTVEGITGDGSFTLAMATGGTIEDLAGNALASTVTSAAVSIDNTPPTILSITPSVSSPTNASSFGFLVQFDEDVLPATGWEDTFDLDTPGVGMIVIGNSNTADSVTITPAGVFGDGTITLTMKTAGEVTDLAGNALLVSPSEVVVVDNTAPGIQSITPDTTNPTNADTVNFTIDFDEPVVGSIIDWFSFVQVTANGIPAVTEFASAVDSDTIVSTVSGISGDGSFTLTLGNSNAVIDHADNPFGATTVDYVMAVDNTPPTVSLSSGVSGLTNANPIPVSVSLSEDSISLDAGAFTAVNGAPANFAGSGDTFTLGLVPAADGPTSLSIAAGAFTDIAGNPSSNGDSLNFTYDGTAPAIVDVTASPSPAMVSDLVTLTFTVQADDLLGDPTVEIDGEAAVLVSANKNTDYTYSWAVPETTASGPVTVEITAVDLAGNQGTYSGSNNLTVGADMPLAAWPAGLVLALAGLAALRRRQRQGMTP